MLYHLTNIYKVDRRFILKFSLKVTLGIFYSLTKDIEYLGFFREEMVIINIELSLYLNPPILKGRVYPVRQQQGVRELSGF
jgi:hypothetical protein